MKYLICNLKSNKSLYDIKEYEEKINKLKSKAELVICPTHAFYSYFNAPNYVLGAQDVSEFGTGPYTGETNAEQLNSFDIKYVIIGHSERRAYLNENERTLKNKIRQALDYKLKVIYCIGETSEENSNKKTNEVLEKQIGRVLNDFTREEIKNIIIAYEPVWAIGTGVTPTTKEITETVLFIKKLMGEYYELETDVLYGGSSSDKNIDELKTIDSIDGLLIGGASLEPEKLEIMIKAIE